MQSAKIGKEDVELEIAYRQQAILCCVIGANPTPAMDLIDGFIRHIWEAYAIDKVVMVRNSLLMVMFANMKDKLAIVQKGVYFFTTSLSWLNLGILK